MQYQEKLKIHRPAWILQKARLSIRQQQRGWLLIKIPISLPVKTWLLKAPEYIPG
jgi:hypothetical protein